MEKFEIIENCLVETEWKEEDTETLTTIINQKIENIIKINLSNVGDL